MYQQQDPYEAIRHTCLRRYNEIFPAKDSALAGNANIEQIQKLENLYEHRNTSIPDINKTYPDHVDLGNAALLISDFYSHHTNSLRFSTSSTSQHMHYERTIKTYLEYALQHYTNIPKESRTVNIDYQITCMQKKLNPQTTSSKRKQPELPPGPSSNFPKIQKTTGQQAGPSTAASPKRKHQPGPSSPSPKKQKQDEPQNATHPFAFILYNDVKIESTIVKFNGSKSKPFYQISWGNKNKIHFTSIKEYIQENRDAISLPISDSGFKPLIAIANREIGEEHQEFYTSLFQALITAGADINEPLITDSRNDFSGTTALCWSTYNLNTQIFDMLIQRPEINIHLQGTYGSPFCLSLGYSQKTDKTAIKIEMAEKLIMHLANKSGSKCSQIKKYCSNAIIKLKEYNLWNTVCPYLKTLTAILANDTAEITNQLNQNTFDILQLHNNIKILENDKIKKLISDNLTNYWNSSTETKLLTLTITNMPSNLIDCQDHRKISGLLNSILSFIPNYKLTAENIADCIDEKNNTLDHNEVENLLKHNINTIFALIPFHTEELNEYITDNFQTNTNKLLELFIQTDMQKQGKIYHKIIHQYLEYNTTLKSSLTDKEIRSALAQNPNNTFVLTERAKAYAVNKMHIEALRDIGKVLSIQPNCEDALLTRGIIYKDQGRHPESLTDLNQALAVNSENNAAKYAIRDIYLIQFKQHMRLLSNSDILEPRLRNIYQSLPQYPASTNITSIDHLLMEFKNKIKTTLSNQNHSTQKVNQIISAYWDEDSGKINTLYRSLQNITQIEQEVIQKKIRQAKENWGHLITPEQSIQTRLLNHCAPKLKPFIKHMIQKIKKTKEQGFKSYVINLYTRRNYDQHNDRIPKPQFSFYKLPNFMQAFSYNLLKLILDTPEAAVQITAIVSLQVDIENTESSPKTPRVKLSLNKTSHYDLTKDTTPPLLSTSIPLPSAQQTHQTTPATPVTHNDDTAAAQAQIQQTEEEASSSNETCATEGVVIDLTKEEVEEVIDLTNDDSDDDHRGPTRGN